MYDDITVVFVRSKMRSDLREIREQLREICEAEATKLYRLAWRMQDHGCDPGHIQKCKEEANKLHMTGYPERAIIPDIKWEYAFRY